MNKIAIIDLGTNTFQLCIYQNTLSNHSLIYSEKIDVSLGENGILNKNIHTNAFDRGINAMIYFKRKCLDYNVKNIKAIGTSALRDAVNKNEFCKKIYELTEINVEVINGKTEAHLIYKGVINSYKENNDCLIMDIGGGSTEIIYVIDKLPKIFSFNIGISRLYQLRELNDPLSSEDINFLINYMDDESKDLINMPKISNFIGAAGSFETFFKMIHSKDIESFNSCSKINTDIFLKHINSIIKSSYNERLNNSNIIPLRKKLLAISALQTQYILNKCKASNVFISSNSLPEGAFFNFAEKGL